MPVIIDSLHGFLDEHGLMQADWCVAFSGGLDSSVLLHALSRIDHAGALRAIHVDHGLHADASVWAEHCVQTGRRWKLPVDVVQVQIGVCGQGLESAARDARYRAFREQLRDGEILFTAHHQQDQLETVLLRLLRGAGPAGLAGIRSRTRFASGWLARPLLDVPHDEVIAYARAQDLSWIEDPSNADPGPDRNYLRHHVLPVLRVRWPAVARTGARAARLCADADELLVELAVRDGARAIDHDRLDLRVLAGLSRRRRLNLLRHFLAGQHATMPSETVLHQAENQLMNAREDATVCVAWSHWQLRRYRGRAYLLHADPDRIEAPRDWAGCGVLRLGPLAGTLSLEETAAGGLDPERVESGFEVRFRTGGEVIRRAGHAHRQALKKLFQAAGIVPWIRSHVPLLYVAGELVAVADLWMAQGWQAKPGKPGLAVCWKPGAALR
ncbi:MAG TPA: tRNA lysidine(34) synthetase TilS [Chromatiales bacterium]|nr:tRNA lysidine(34) synthetase TilS [Chromatiales bacterium]